jgi:hypothetical protein
MSDLKKILASQSTQNLLNLRDNHDCSMTIVENEGCETCAVVDLILNKRYEAGEKIEGFTPVRERIVIL